MDGKLLMDAIVSANGDVLRTAYALFFRMSLFGMIRNQIQGLVSKLFNKETQDYFYRELRREVMQLRTIPDHQLQLELILGMMRALKLRGSRFQTEREFIDQGERIVQETLKWVREEDKEFQGSTLQELVQHQLQNVFRLADKCLAHASDQEQRDFVEKVAQFLHQLPAEQQAKLKEKLGIDEFSHQVLRNVLSAGGASLLFAAVVEVSGFAFYTAASSFLASAAGLFGLTLPFAAYTTLSSLIAVLASPVFILGVLAGSVWYMHAQENKLRKKLIPLVVLQVLLPYVSDGQARADYRAVIRTWNRIEEEYTEIVRNVKAVSDSIASVEQEWHTVNEQIQTLKKQIRAYEEEIRLNKQKIRNQLTDSQIRALTIHSRFERLKIRYFHLQHEISVKKKRRNQGLFARIGQTVQTMVAEHKLSKVLDEMVEAISVSGSPFCRLEQQKIQAAWNGLKNCEGKLREALAIREQVEERLAELKQQHKDWQKVKDELEKRYYGLEHLAV